MIVQDTYLVRGEEGEERERRERERREKTQPNDVTV